MPNLIEQSIYDLTPPRSPFVRPWRRLKLGRQGAQSMRARRRRLAKAEWRRGAFILHEWPTSSLP
jgi:hypothetical protein